MNSDLHVLQCLCLWIWCSLIILASIRRQITERDGSLCWNCSCSDTRARFKLVWLRGRCDWLKMVLISSQGWCKTCRARLNASNPGCFTENNPGTAASAPGSCAGAAFKETAGPKISPKPSPHVYNRRHTGNKPELMICIGIMWKEEI